MWGAPSCRLSLADYEDQDLSPQRSEDLLRAADHPERNVFYPYFRVRLPELMDRAEDREIVGMSLSYLSQAVCAFAMIGFLRRGYPRVRIVLGGSLTTSWMTGPQWKNPFKGLIDDLVSGPGEQVLLAMAGERTDKQFFTPNFNGLPLKEYLSPGSIIPYAASRGCYWRGCSFCPEKSEGMVFSPTPPALVIEDLRWLSSRYEPVLIHLVDDAMSPALMRRMVSDPPGRPWYGFSRAIPELADPDFCKGLKASGCVMVKLGLESGDQAVLDALGKGITLKLASQVLTSLKGAGIATYVYLLFGTPPETPRGRERPSNTRRPTIRT